MQTLPMDDAQPTMKGIERPWILGVIAALWMVAAMYAHRLFFGIASVPGLITERILPFVPGAISNVILGKLGQFAKLIPEISAILAILVVGGLVGGWYAHSWGRAGQPLWKRRAFGPLASLGLWVATAAALWPVLHENYHGWPLGTGRVFTLLAILVDYLIFGVLLTVLDHIARRVPETSGGAAAGRGLSRRQAISAIGGGALVVAAACAAGLQRLSTFGYDGKSPKRPVQPLTDNAEFYSVTKNLADPTISDAGRWRLEMDGMVGNPMTLGFDDLRAMPATELTATLLCIGNILGGGLASTAVWRGVPLMSLIAQAKPQDGVKEVLFTGVDGYTNTVAIDKVAAENIFVAYMMNGAPLPQKHGFPVRIITPGRYGEKHVKWVTRITLQKAHTASFYESEGWDRDAVVQTTSRIDAPMTAEVIPMGKPYMMKGIAFGGLRGVGKVEVTTDNGATWQPAMVTANPSPQSWSLWEYAWTPTKAGMAALSVRCTEKDGTPQNPVYQPNYPAGAVGLHMLDVMVR